MPTPPRLRQPSYTPTIVYLKRRKPLAPVQVTEIPAPEHAKLASKGIVYGDEYTGIDPHENADKINL